MMSRPQTGYRVRVSIGWPCMMSCELASLPSKREVDVHSLPWNEIVYRERVDAQAALITYRFNTLLSSVPGMFIRVPVPGLSAQTYKFLYGDDASRRGTNIEWVVVRVPEDFQPGGSLIFKLPHDFAEGRARVRGAVRLQAAARGLAARKADALMRAVVKVQAAARGLVTRQAEKAGRRTVRRTHAAHRTRKKQLVAAGSSTSSGGGSGSAASEARSAQLVWVESEMLRAESTLRWEQVSHHGGVDECGEPCIGPMPRTGNVRSARRSLWRWRQGAAAAAAVTGVLRRRRVVPLSLDS
jgi:hypothetical protein